MVSSPERWQRLQALFYEALELPNDSREAFLEKNCDGDAELRKEMQDLLDSSEKPVDFLQRLVLAAANQMMAEKGRAAVFSGTHLAHYEIVSLLGAGGMGEVYLDEDVHLRRKVALKMPKPELTRDERDLRRFERRLTPLPP